MAPAAKPHHHQRHPEAAPAPKATEAPTAGTTRRSPAQRVALSAAVLIAALGRNKVRRASLFMSTTESATRLMGAMIRRSTRREVPAHEAASWMPRNAWQNLRWSP